MQDHHPILSAFQAWRGAPMALATVISTWGSAPRPRGSHMLVHADGRFEGSVSGGCVEGDVLVVAQQVIASGHSERRVYGVADASAWEVGLPCGGSIEILAQPLSEGGFAPDILDAVMTAQEEGRALRVATDLASGQSRLATQAEESEFLNIYAPPRRLFIVGAVQIARHLVEIAQTLGMRPVLIDPRGKFLTEARFPNVELDDRWPDEALMARRLDTASAVMPLAATRRATRPPRSNI